MFPLVSQFVFYIKKNSSAWVGLNKNHRINDDTHHKLVGVHPDLVHDELAEQADGETGWALKILWTVPDSGQILRRIPND